MGRFENRNSHTRMDWRSGFYPFLLEACAILYFSRVWLFVTLWTVARQAPLSMESSRQEYWGGLSFPSPGDLHDPGIKPTSPTLQADSLLPEPPGKPLKVKWSPPHIFSFNMPLALDMMHFLIVGWNWTMYNMLKMYIQTGKNWALYDRLLVQETKPKPQHFRVSN